MHTAITGATGFLGLHVVRELLERDGSLTLVAHAGSGSALDRLTRFLTMSGAPRRLIADISRRITVVEADIAQPRLGLPERAFRELADSIDVLWHSAANTTLGGEPTDLHRVNVDGTRHVLDLAGAGTRRPPVYHVSTAFVAGARRDPVVYEDELDPSQGFENPYERSKYEAEVVVREWAAARSWPVVVFRPSILVTDRPPHPDLPAHTLGSVARWILTIASMAAELGLGGDGEPAPPGSPVPTVRLVGDPQARWNLMPVEDAAREMARIADRPPPEGITTYHIVQGRDLPAALFIDLLEGFFPVHLELVSSPPADRSRLERMIDAVPGFTMYLGHRHAFDDTRTRTVLGERQAGTQVDREYLLSSFGAEDPARPRPAAPSAGPIDVPVDASSAFAAASRLPAPAPATDTPDTDSLATDSLAIDTPACDRSRR